MKRDIVLSATTAAFDSMERDAVYRVIQARRDVRSGFLAEPMSDEVMTRLLKAAHCAPSVGLMQPSRFIVVRAREVRKRIHQAFVLENEAASTIYNGDQLKQYESLKLEAILEAPQNLCVVCDPGSKQGHGLGRQSMPETAIYSTVCAVQNLWLAARAEGVGVGWVSILSQDALRAILNIPPRLIPVAYLCLGHVDEFGTEPELERVRWEKRVELDDVVYHETYSERDKLEDSQTGTAKATAFRTR